MTTPVTVVVCSYNGGRRIGATLEALQAQRCDVPFDLLVVDDGSRDDTAEVARRAGVRVERHTVNRGLAAARQTAVAAVTSPYLAFTDDDCRPAPDWLARLWAAKEAHPEAGAWGGLIVPGPVLSLVDRYMVENNPWSPLGLDLATSAGPAYRLRRYLTAQCRAPRVPAGPVFSLVGGNMMLEKEAIEAVGGFDTRFVFGSEDEELLKRVRESGRPLWFIPEAHVAHERVGSVRTMAARSFQYGRGNARMFVNGFSRTPTLYPLPLLALAGLVAGPRGRAAVALAPVVAYPRWASAAVRRASVAPLAYAYLQFVQEAASDAGWLRYAVE